MAEKQKNVNDKKKGKKGKGFYIAMYASLAGILVLAVAIGYNSLLRTDDGDVFNVAELNLPVAGTHDVPIVQQPPTQTQTSPVVPHDEDGTISGDPPPYDTWVQTPEPQPEPPTEPPDEPVFAPYEVFEPEGPAFTLFTAGDDMHWPILGDIVMDFSIDRHIWCINMDQWRTNDNIAIRASAGDAVRSAAAGIVQYVEDHARNGQTVVIDHGNGWVTTYKQLASDVAVAVGDVVNRGQIIGHVGQPSMFTAALGHHVGFAVRQHGTPQNPHALLSTN